MFSPRVAALFLFFALTSSFAAAQNSRRAQPVSLLGKSVFWKDGATAKIDDAKIDINTVGFPAKVTKVEGDWVWLGRAWLRKSDVMLLDQAITYYSDQVRRNPRSPQAWFRRAICWNSKGELNKALADFDEAIRLDAKYENAYVGRGYIKDRLGDFAGAVRDQDAAIELNPKNAAAHNNRGLAKAALKDHAGAIKDYDVAIRLNPGDAYTYSNRAWAKFLTGDYGGAISDYEENIRREPEAADPHANLAFILASCPDAQYRNPAAALSHAERSLSLAPKYGYAWNAKACALAASGDFAGAIAAEQTALEDKNFAADEAIDGGKLAPERRQKWQAGQLWLAESKR